MKAIKAKHKDAEALRKKLLSEKALDTDYKVKSDQKFVYFPLLKEVKGTLIEEEFEKVSRKGNLKHSLQGKLSEEELNKIKRSLDIIGTIAILEIDETLRSKEKLIAETLLSANKAFKTVVRKKGEHQGIYRIQDYEYLAGEKTFETIHTESGVKFFLDIRNTYFSPRLSTERLRISKLIKKGEKILVLFSGIGAYPLVFSKQSKACEIYGVEINPDAHAYAEKNILLNKASNVFLYCGDAREVASHFGKTFDRILMPLPQDADQFFSLIPSLSKKGTVVHYYAIASEDSFDVAKKKVVDYFGKVTFLGVFTCGQVKPRTYRICVDFRL